MSEFALLKIPIADSEELIPLKHIVSYKVLMIDVDGDGAGTSEDGFTIRDVRRRNKVKITVKFDGLNLTEFTELMTHIDGVSFSIIYFDGSYKTITAYAGDRNFELIKAANELDSRWKLDVSFIEY